MARAGRSFDYLRGKCRRAPAGASVRRHGRRRQDRAPLGTLLRDWRQRRRLSQLDLALEAGRLRPPPVLPGDRPLRPSREMVLHLAEELDVPLRDRNRLLLAAGYAPAYGERPLDAPEMEPVRDALALVLDGHDPYPAAVVDRQWELVAGNRGLGLLVAGVAPELLEPPVNVMRLSLHPDGVAPRIAQPGRVAGAPARAPRPAGRADRRSGARRRCGRRSSAYPAPEPEPGHAADDLVVPLRLRTDDTASWRSSAPSRRSARRSTSRSPSWPSSRSSPPTRAPPRRCARRFQTGADQLAATRRAVSRRARARASPRRRASTDGPPQPPAVARALPPSPSFTHWRSFAANSRSSAGVSQRQRITSTSPLPARRAQSPLPAPTTARSGPRPSPRRRPRSRRRPPRPAARASASSPHVPASRRSQPAPAAACTSQPHRLRRVDVDVGVRVHDLLGRGRRARAVGDVDQRPATARAAHAAPPTNRLAALVGEDQLRLQERRQRPGVREGAPEHPAERLLRP